MKSQDAYQQVTITLDLNGESVDLVPGQPSPRLDLALAERGVDSAALLPVHPLQRRWGAWPGRLARKLEAQSRRFPTVAARYAGELQRAARPDPPIPLGCFLGLSRVEALEEARRLRLDYLYWLGEGQALEVYPVRSFLHDMDDGSSARIARRGLKELLNAIQEHRTTMLKDFLGTQRTRALILIACLVLLSLAGRVAGPSLEAFGGEESHGALSLLVLVLSLGTHPVLIALLAVTPALRSRLQEACAEARERDLSLEEVRPLLARATPILLGAWCTMAVAIFAVHALALAVNLLLSLTTDAAAPSLLSPLRDASTHLIIALWILPVIVFGDGAASATKRIFSSSAVGALVTAFVLILILRIGLYFTGWAAGRLALWLLNYLPLDLPDVFTRGAEGLIGLSLELILLTLALGYVWMRGFDLLLRWLTARMDLPEKLIPDAPL